MDDKPKQRIEEMCRQHAENGADKHQVEALKRELVSLCSDADLSADFMENQGREVVDEGEFALTWSNGKGAQAVSAQRRRCKRGRDTTMPEGSDAGDVRGRECGGGVRMLFRMPRSILFHY